MADRPLEGKVAIITGAASPIGIGHASTLGLVRAGAKVALTDINQEWLDQTINEVREIGGDDCAIDIICDVTDPQACQDAVDTTITHLGGLHILVNNAGTNPRVAGLGPTSGATPTNFWENSPEAWSRVVAVNLSGNFWDLYTILATTLDLSKPSLVFCCICGVTKPHWSMPSISTGMSMSATPRFSRSHTNCSKYETPVDMLAAKAFTGTISIPASICPKL